MTAFAIRSLMEGKAADAQRIYEKVCVPEEENLLRKWYGTDNTRRPMVLQRFIDKIPKLNMGLEYDLTTGQIQLQYGTVEIWLRIRMRRIRPLLPET